ncbi:metal ABC transporter substrate-binding protein [Clostridium magnum]|uniref:High-affinity zinc uptake system binding-protein ZnuA n=1 Tax=Clostridium magnum DSM 2767 TaxID=1121326 RepID=A0A162S5L0_9CLOT|nr:metal ABC transporter substrate-binding protein [Clostridium magnum]KZL90804.1 high-affinity zinc uptake system binding-protein ZnuA precursor [Clostridium magnum DSM 2767]SHI11675.1 zinc transport system substrate-binding protein [Clostridium magnum DSM 2767]
MFRKVILSLISIILLMTLVACGDKNVGVSVNENNSSDNNGKIKVVASFNAMTQFIKAVGKDKVDVQTMIPSGTEPHDFEPKPKDLENISKAQIFVYNGLGMENWVDKTIKAADNKNLIVVEASRGGNPIKNSDEDAVKEHGQYDPHMWISLSGAKIEAKNIKDALVKVDPSNKDYYEKNYNEFASKLDVILNDYKTKFDQTSSKNFITGHAAFAYFCRDFGLQQNSVENVFAEGEPTAKRLEELVDYCKKNDVKTVFMEEMASPKVSETLAKEVDAKVEKIYTAESEEDGKDYIESMKENLDKVYESLK